MKTREEVEGKYQEVRFRLEESQHLLSVESDAICEASLVEDIDYYAAACYWLSWVLAE